MNGSAPADDETGFRLLTDKIARERQFACGSYKDRCLRRRIAVRMRACRAPTFRAYARHLDEHPAEWDQLLSTLTISVTKFFRNRDVYDVVGGDVVPALWASPAPVLRVWSAGCATGEEPYSLAILFHQHAAAAGDDAGARVRVLASDVDGAAIETARLARYGDAALAETPPAVRDAYFRGSRPAVLAPEVRTLVRFERRDLLSDEPPAGPFHLIVCRNVMIYLDRDAQAALVDRFRGLLAPGGFLVLGKTETLFGHDQRSAFDVIDARTRVYRRRE